MSRSKGQTDAVEPCRESDAYNIRHTIKRTYTIEHHFMVAKGDLLGRSTIVDVDFLGEHVLDRDQGPVPRDRQTRSNLVENPMHTTYDIR